MTTWPRCVLETVLVIGACLLPASLPAQASLEYQSRGDRYEGVRPRPVSGSEVELISALVDHQEPAAKLPDQLKIRLFLEEQSEIHLTVRELDVKHYYWLDRARPARPWVRGFDNEFAWPTDLVLRRLDPGLPLSALGVVARLDRPEPSADERVAPVVFYHGRPPAVVRGYIFAFKASADAQLAYAMYRDGQNRPLVSEGPLRPRGERAFAVHWDASRAEPGQYRLVLNGYFLDSNQPLRQTVRFFHQPAIP